MTATEGPVPAGSNRTAVLALLLIAGLALALGAPAATAQAAPSTDCTIADEGAIYTADSGLTVSENDANITYGTFTGSDTVAFQGGEVTVLAAGDSEVRIDDGTNATTCLGGVNATQSDVTVSTNQSGTVRLAGEYDTFAYRDVAFERGDGGTDLAYNATDPARVTIAEPRLTDGLTVYAVDANDGTQLDSATAGATSVTFEGLDSGSNEVDIEVEELTVSTYADDDGVVTTNGLRQAVTHWQSDWIDTPTLLDVIDAWVSGDPVS